MRIHLSDGTSCDGKTACVIRGAPSALSFGDIRGHARTCGSELRAKLESLVSWKELGNAVALASEFDSTLPNEQLPVGTQGRWIGHASTISAFERPAVIISTHLQAFSRIPVAGGLWPVAYPA